MYIQYFIHILTFAMAIILFLFLFIPPKLIIVDEQLLVHYGFLIRGEMLFNMIFITTLALTLLPRLAISQEILSQLTHIRLKERVR